MRYNWDLEKLRYRRNLLKEIAEKAENKDVKYNAIEQVIIYTDMIKSFQKQNNSMKDLDDTMFDASIDQLVREVMLFYQQNNPTYTNLLLQSFFVIKDISTRESFNRVNIAATNDDLIDITREFFKKKTPPYIAKEFDSILATKDTIHIVYNKGNEGYSGYTLFDNFLSKKYIFVNRNNTLNDLNILPHEVFHHIYEGKEAAIANLYDSYFLTEVEGMFANLLFGDFFKEVSVENANYFIDYEIGLFKHRIDDMVTRNTVLDSLRENGKIRLAKLNKFLGTFDVLPFEDIDELRPYLEQPQETITTYALSYLVAIDLYYKYLKDPEEAFYTLGCISYIKRTNDLLTLLRNNGITFMDDDYQNLKQYIKKGTKI